jgi:hypothetical protein
MSKPKQKPADNAFYQVTIFDVLANVKKAPPNAGHAEAFRKSAASLTDKIDERKNLFSNCTVTRRRAQFMESGHEEAQRLERMQSILYRLADLVESGDLPESLQAIKTRAQVETLIASEKMRTAWARRRDLVEALDKCKGLPGTAEVSERLRMLIRHGATDGHSVDLCTLADVKHAEKIVKLAKEHGMTECPLGAQWCGRVQAHACGRLEDPAKYQKARLICWHWLTSSASIRQRIKSAKWSGI